MTSHERVLERVGVLLGHESTSVESPTYEVSAVRFATRQTRAGEVFLNHHLYGEPEREITLDYFLWVIRGSGRTILIDTGFSPQVGADRGRQMVCPVPEALAAHGVRPDDVDTVVITHAHWDHTGNLDLFPEARVLIASAELNFWQGPHAGRTQIAHAGHAPDLTTLAELERAGRVERLDGDSHEIAPGVLTLTVGGHTPGQLMVLATGERNPVLLTSDAVHFEEEVERDRPFAVLTDLPAMYEAYDLVSALSARFPDLAVVAGHDPAVLAAHPPSLPERPELGVRVG